LAGNLGSTSATLAQSVVPFSTTTSLVGDPNPSVLGQPVIFRASVTTSAGPVTSGTVTFRRGSQILGSVALGTAGTAGLIVASLPLGTARIQAIYDGTPDALSSVSPVIAQKVNRLPTTTIAVATTTKAPNGANRYVVIVTVTSGGDSALAPSGMVVFRKNGVAITRTKLRQGRAVLVLGRRVPRGDYSAVFQGGARFRPSKSARVAFVS
jgi:hypothetical protein